MGASECADVADVGFYMRKQSNGTLSKKPATPAVKVKQRRDKPRRQGDNEPPAPSAWQRRMRKR